MDIKKDKKIFIDYIYDRFEKYAISQVTEKEFVISIDHYNVNINLHYVRNSKTTNIYRYLTKETLIHLIRRDM